MMISRILDLTTVIAPDGEHMPLRDAPDEIQTKVLAIIRSQKEREDYIGIVDTEGGEIWHWEY